MVYSKTCQTVIPVTVTQPRDTVPLRKESGKHQVGRQVKGVITVGAFRGEQHYTAIAVMW